MDPISITLGVITLATAVKDMVELAEKIHASFVKVSDNLRNAQVLANEIKQITYELKEFCDRHYKTLENAVELRAALRELISKMNIFQSDIVPLIPIPKNTLRGRLKGSFHAWKNNNHIEASIRELKKEVKMCHMKFVMMGVARIEVKLDEIQKTTSQGFRVVHQGISNLVSSSPMALAWKSSSSSTTYIDSSKNSIVAFAQTSSATSTPMWNTPSAIKDQIIWDTYLKGQIDSISESLSGLATIDASYNIEPLESYTGPFSPMVVTSLRPEYCDPQRLHRDVVIQSLQIRKTLENHPTSASVQEGAWSLVDLSIGLHYLGMPQDAVAMGKWAVELFRVLASVDAATYSPFLAHSLKHLSHFYTEIGHTDASFSAIREAVGVSSRLQTSHTSTNLRVQYCSMLTIYAKHVSAKDTKRAIALATESVEVMEDVVRVKSLPHQHTKVDGVLIVNPQFLADLYRTSPSDHVVVEYARALRELSDCFLRDGQLRQSLDSRLFALSIYQDPPRLISHTMNEELGSILHDIITQETKSLLPLKTLLKHAEDYIQIIRKRVETNASANGRTLCNALWEKASLLNLLGRHDDAVDIWKEIANLAQDLIDDQMYYANALSQVSWSFRNLKRHEDAANFRKQSLLTFHDISNTISPSQAYSYYDLCVDLQLANRYSEAAQAAQNAINQSRTLALTEDGHSWIIQVGRGQTALANSLLHIGDQTNALKEAFDALQVLHRVVSLDPSCVGYYLYALRVNLEIAITVDDASASVKRFKHVLEMYRNLAKQHPDDVGLCLLEAEIDYGHNLDRLDRLTEARQHFEDLLGQWESSKYIGHPEDQVAHLHISALISYASILDNQGHTEQALEPIAKCARIGRPFCANYPSMAGQTVGAMYRHAQLLVELGRYKDALEMAEETLAFSQTVQMDDVANMVGTMHVVSIAADRMHLFGRVIEVSQKAVDICRGDEMRGHCQMDTRSLMLLPRSLQFLSSGEADLGLRVGLGHAYEAVDEARSLKSNSLIASGDAEKSYMDARGHLGIVLFSHGNFVQACEIFEERRTYLEGRVKQRNGEYGELVAVLYRLGIMYCHEERHADGSAMANELDKITSRLETIFPSLYTLVKIDMRHEISIPALKELRKWKDNLVCDHHIHISFE